MCVVNRAQSLPPTVSPRRHHPLLFSVLRDSIHSRDLGNPANELSPTISPHREDHPPPFRIVANAGSSLRFPLKSSKPRRFYSPRHSVRFHNGQIPLLAPFTILVMLSILDTPRLDTAVPLHKKGPLTHPPSSHQPEIDPWGTVVYRGIFYRGNSF